MISAILLAGGSGKRMGPGDVDKLMIPVLNFPLLAHVLRAFEDCPEVDEIVLVARKDRIASYQKLGAEHQISKLRSVIPGGIERQDSVWCGLQAVSSQCEIILIHDGARALVTRETISRCIQSAQATGAAIPASRVKDTIKLTAASQSPTGDSFPQVKSTLDRSLLWAAQTPQTFRVDLIRRAYEPLIRSRTIVTDDAAAVEELGHPVSLVECDPLNLKITTPEDLILAEAILKKRNLLEKAARPSTKTSTLHSSL